MALKDLFTMVKSDRYTQDGRDQLIKAQEVETEDRTYNIGEISEKTGLQKTANGWVKPKKSGKITPKGKDLMERAARNPKLSEHGRAAASKLAKEYGEKLSGSNGSESTSAGGAEKHAKAMENAKKVGIVSKVPEGWKKAEGVTTVPNGYVAITNGGSHFPKEGQQKKEIKFIKEEDFNYDDFMKEHKKREFQELYGDAIKFDEYGLPSKETVELKENFLRKKGISDPNKLSNKEFNDLAKELDDQFGINNLELSQELLVAETVPAAPKGNLLEQAEKIYVQTEEDIANPNLSREEWMKVKGKQQDSYRLRELLEFGVDENGKPKNERVANEIKTLTQNLGLTAQDSAPRILTGDTRIRIRK